jgi:transcriptional regulator with XRE-family HTH domain
MTAAELGRASGLSTSFIANLLNDLRQAGPEAARKIARALGMPQYVVFLAAGLLTEAPRLSGKATGEDWRVTRLLIRLEALPPAERDRLISLGHSLIDLVARPAPSGKATGISDEKTPIA